MSGLLVKNIEQGKTITFRSKNINDTVLWKGILEIPVGTYAAIRGYMNPQSYNEAVRQSDASVTSDLSLLNYFLITVDNGSENPTTQVFAQEWIAAGSLAILNLGNKVQLQVDDPFSDTLKIVSLLASAGYKTKIIS